MRSVPARTACAMVAPSDMTASSRCGDTTTTRPVKRCCVDSIGRKRGSVGLVGIVGVASLYIPATRHLRFRPFAGIVVGVTWSYVATTILNGGRPIRKERPLYRSKYQQRHHQKRRVASRRHFSDATETLVCHRLRNAGSKRADSRPSDSAR